MPKGSQPDGEMLKGILDMMILRTLLGGAAHGLVMGGQFVANGGGE
jgi:hypothetical protein